MCSGEIYVERCYFVAMGRILMVVFVEECEEEED